MDCTKYHRNINAFLDNELSEVEEFYLLKHLRICENCKIYLNNISKLKTHIKESYTNKSSPNIDLSKSIMHQIKHKQSANKTKKRKNTLVKVALLAAIFLSYVLINNISLSKNKNTYTFKEEEKLLLEHLEKSNNTKVISVAYSMER
ncbi:MAG: zf-HC2 domain-containing protein [Calditerrivibrio sp.]|nr:zf-HC2 domain-containing protein [Calditerrivibrio sp.]